MSHPLAQGYKNIEYGRVLCVKKKKDWKEQPGRTLYSNVPDVALGRNDIHTAKYNFWTWLPLSLWEQFSR
jgi:hypothetical protein